MQILNINYSNTLGGASRALMRHHTELIRVGLDSKILVQYKANDHKHVYGPVSNIGKLFGLLKPDIDALPLFAYPKRSKFPFQIQWTPSPSHINPTHFDADIIHLHWICGGTLRIESLNQIRQPIIWTLHDMCPFTGGCNHSDKCCRYEESCGQCPLLSSQRDYDLSRWIWKRKKKALKKLNPIIISPSNWIAGKAKSSRLFKNFHIEVIPNGIDTNEFKPINKQQARSLLNISSTKKIILFGAQKAIHNIFKGFDLLLSALNKLNETILNDQIQLFVFGASEPILKKNNEYPIHYMGNLSDHISLQLLYSAADVFVAPSLQDNLPYTIMEAMACGTPCVGFNVGGIPDLIDHKTNGYLAKHLDILDLANGIKWILEDKKLWKSYSMKAREKIENEFDITSVVRHYLSLYEEAKKRHRVFNK